MQIHLILSIFTLTILQVSTDSTRTLDGDEESPQVNREELSVSADENEATPKKKNSSILSLAMKTGGGTQLWTDHLYRDGYRIQQNALTGHWRLLDADDIRKTWGQRTHCESVLDDLHPKDASVESSKHAVVLLHGLMRTRHSMKPLEAQVAKEVSPNVIRFSYASTRSSIGDHAIALREVLENLPDDTEFSFIGHSMGNIVVRHLIGDLQREGDPHGLLPRCRSMVMLGPPNQGAAIAKRLAPTGLYGIVTGQGGMQLGPKWQDFAQHLATPPFPFAIIAGDLSENRLQNPLINGSSDYIVTVGEAELDGAESFETVPVLHSLLMSDETARKMAIDFIKSH